MIKCFHRQTERVVTVDGGVISGAEKGDKEQLQELPERQKEEVEIAGAICDDNDEGKEQHDEIC